MNNTTKYAAIIAVITILGCEPPGGGITIKPSDKSKSVAEQTAEVTAIEVAKKEAEKKNAELPGSGDYVPQIKQELPKAAVDEKIEAILNEGLPKWTDVRPSEETFQTYVDYEKYAIDIQNTKDLIQKAIVAERDINRLANLNTKLVEAKNILAGAVFLINNIVNANERLIPKVDKNNPFNRYFYAYHTHEDSIYYRIKIPPMNTEKVGVQYQWRSKQEALEEGNDKYYIESAGLGAVLTKEKHPIIEGANRYVVTFNFEEGNKETFKEFSYKPRRFILYGNPPKHALIAENDDKLIFTNKKQH